MFKLRKIILMFMFAFISVFLVGCGKTYYFLQLPEHVTAEVEDYTKILKDSEITLIITVPENKELDKLVVNDIEVNVVDNKFTFSLSKNTIVQVHFNDIQTDKYYKLTLPNGVTSNIDNLNKVKENTEVTININLEENKEVQSFKVNGKEQSLTNLTYTFTIKEDTIVELVLKDKVEEPTEQKYYKLTLPKGITANVDNVNKIKENTNVELTLELGLNESLKSFKVNGEEKEFSSNNKFTFIINEDTVVELVVVEDEEPVEYVTVIFEDELGNVSIATIEIEKDNKIKRPENPYKKGYTFVGWYLDGELFDFDSEVDKDTVLRAVFTPIEDNILVELIDLFMNANLELVKEGTLKATIMGFEEDDNFFNGKVYLKFNELLDLEDFYLNILNVEDEDYTEFIEFYADGTYIYLDNNIVYEQEPLIMMVPLNKYFIDMVISLVLSEILPFLELIIGENPFEDFDFDLLSFLISNNLVEYFDYEKVDDQTIISLPLDNDKLLEILEGTELEDFLQFIELDEFIGNFEIVFEDYEIVDINLEFLLIEENIDFVINLSYVDEEIEIPDAILNVDENTFEYNTYNLHITDDEVLTFKLQRDLLDYLEYDLNYPIGEILLPQRTGYEAIGLYSDEERTKIIVFGDLLNDEVHLYVGWKKLED